MMTVPTVTRKAWTVIAIDDDNYMHLTHNFTEEYETAGCHAREYYFRRKIE